MNNIVKKIVLFILILTVLIIGINIFMSINEGKYIEYESGIINIGNAKTLQIDNNKITNLSQRSGKDTTAMTKIKNTSNLNISKIGIIYDELDKNDKVISDSKLYLDITLSPKEVMKIEFTPKDYTDSIEITGYTYIVEDCKVFVDLKDNDIKIVENEKYLQNSKNYDVISINKVQKDNLQQNDLNFSIEIENWEILF